MLNPFWERKYIFPKINKKRKRKRKDQLGLSNYPSPNRGSPCNLLWPIKEIFSFKVREGIIRYDERWPTETVANQIETLFPREGVFPSFKGLHATSAGLLTHDFSKQPHANDVFAPLNFSNQPFRSPIILISFTFSLLPHIVHVQKLCVTVCSACISFTLSLSYF